MLWLLLVLSIRGYASLTWDYYLSKYLFSQYCSDSRVGYEIYERVDLGGEYFVSLETNDIDIHRLDRRFAIGDSKAIGLNEITVVQTNQFSRRYCVASATMVPNDLIH